MKYYISKRHKDSSGVHKEINNMAYYGQGMIKDCRQIRLAMMSGKVVIDETPHKVNNGYNTHLFKLIKASGMTLKNFISGFLSVLQPYALSLFMSNRVPSQHIWLVDMGYRYKLVVKVCNDTVSGETVVVSFHESNSHGRPNRGVASFNDKLCAVFVDRSEKQSDDTYKVQFTVQKGFIRTRVSAITGYLKNDVALVKYSSIQGVFNTCMHRVWEKLNEEYYGSGENSTLFVGVDGLDNLSFLSYGYFDFNSLCFLLDLYSRYTSDMDRRVLLDVVCNVISELSEVRKQELLSGLHAKYGIASDMQKNALYLAVIDNLGGDNA